MTKGEYCREKGIKIFSKTFKPNEEADDDFKHMVDFLVGNYEPLYTEDEDSEV